jgi:hypothetical protein
VSCDNREYRDKDAGEDINEVVASAERSRRNLAIFQTTAAGLSLSASMGISATLAAVDGSE